MCFSGVARVVLRLNGGLVKTLRARPVEKENGRSASRHSARAVIGLVGRLASRAVVGMR